MPLDPKVASTLNNCPLHALTPEIKNEVLKIATDNQYDNGHKKAYNDFKDCFAIFYGFKPEEFDWNQFSRILKCFNAFDTQIIMGPVLRSLMKNTISPDDETIQLLALSQNTTSEEYIKNLTEINLITGRYASLSPDELFLFASKPLGLNLDYYPQDNINKLLKAEAPVATIKIYHQGSIEGAEAGGHWERTKNGEQSFDYQNQKDTQLNSTLPLLGQDPAVNPYGVDLLKKHVQLVARSLLEKNQFTAEFSKLRLTKLQISKYLEKILYVSKEHAIELLGKDLTEYSLSFIDQYEVSKKDPNLFDNYIEDKKSGFESHLNEQQMKIMEQLLRPVMADGLEQPPEVSDLNEDHNTKDPHNKPDNPELNNNPQTRPMDLNEDDKEILRFLGITDFNVPIKSPKPTPAEEKLIEHLTALRNKSHELYKRKKLEAAGKAFLLYLNLTSASNEYFKDTLNADRYKIFSTKCNQLIDQARPELEKYRDWKPFLANLALAIAGLGVVYLIAAGINKVTTGRFRLFPTDSARKIEAIEESINKAEPEKEKPGI